MALFFIPLIILHRRLSLFLFLSISSVAFGSPLLIYWSLQVRESQAISFLLFKVQQAGYCWELPLFSCTCLFSIHLPLSSLRRECRPAQMLWKDHYTHTALTHLHVLCTPVSVVQRRAHRGTFFCICILPRSHPACFELSWRAALYEAISWSNEKFPVVTSRLLTVCPLGCQRESRRNIGRRSCHAQISALMSHIKRCPYLNVTLEGKTGGGVCVTDVCVWGRYSKIKEGRMRKQDIKT